MSIAKEAAGKSVVDLLEDGQLIVVGTGSTVDIALAAMAARISSEALSVRALVSSYQSARSCGAIGIEVVDPLAVTQSVSWGFDGADEVDANLRLIKGAGAALLREKLLAHRCRVDNAPFLVVVDESKVVSRLGERFRVPVEVVPEAYPVLEAVLLREFVAEEVCLRDAMPGKHGPVITERGNLILDVRFAEIDDSLEQRLNALPGVVENGIFTRYATEVRIGDSQGNVQIR